MKYLATFYTHYGAMLFHRRYIPSSMAPVPRELSASCGVCVRFDADRAPDKASHEDMEDCYSDLGDGTYVKLGGDP